MEAPPARTTKGRRAVNDERTVYECCPLCESASVVHHLDGNCSYHACYDPSLSPVIRWLRCVPCGHIFTDGYYTEAALGVVFRRSNEGQRGGYDVEAQRHVSARMVEKVLPYASGGSWLDVGFGNGSLLVTAREYGFVPVGLDLRAETVASLAQIGVESHCADITTFVRDEPLTVISMADVLEHMPFPKVGLRAAHRLLIRGGVLFASMPNVESAVWEAWEQQGTNPYWGELEHYHNFGRRRLYDLLREHAFEPVRYGVSERYRSCMEVIAIRR